MKVTDGKQARQEPTKPASKKFLGPKRVEWLPSLQIIVNACEATFH